MDSGKLDRRIDIQSQGTGLDDYGQHNSENWTDIVLRFAAGYRPLRGTERNTAEQWVGKEQVEFTVRYSSIVATLTTKDRIIYPATSESASPPEEVAENRIFDIISINEIGRRSGLKILAARRSDS